MFARTPLIATPFLEGDHRQQPEGSSNAEIVLSAPLDNLYVNKSSRELALDVDANSAPVISVYSSEFK